MSRSIDEIEGIGFAVCRNIWQGYSLAFNSDSALTFDIHIVEHLVLHFPLINDMGFFDESIGQCRFSMVNMCDDTEISD